MAVSLCAMLVLSVPALGHVGHTPTSDGKRYSVWHPRAGDAKPKKVKGLPTPGNKKIAHLSPERQRKLWRILKWRLWPSKYKAMRRRNMSNRDRFLNRLRFTHGYSESMIGAADWLLSRESCGGYSEWSYYGSCSGTPGYNRNGENIACGVPMFLPCRHHGDLIGQADAFARYVSGRYGGIFGAKSFKARTGWY